MPLNRRSASLPVPGFVLAVTAGLVISVTPATSQAAASEACPEGVVEHIFIDNHSIFDTSDPELDPRARWAYSLANKLHIRTSREFIGRELLFRRGDCYDPLLLEESGRLLRGYDFIARADVYEIRQPDGTYHVVVDTEDEWSTQVEVQFDVSGDLEFEALEVREKNLLGTGQSLEFFYRSLDATLAYGLRFQTPQLFRTRWDLELAAGRTRAGTLFHQELRYPFLGETGQWAMREWFQHEDRFFDYVLPRASGFCPPNYTCRVLVPARQRGFHVAGLRRFGRRGDLTVLGGGFSIQRLSFPGDPASAITLVQGGDYDTREPAPPELQAAAAALMTPLESVRAVLLAGKRNITWQRRSGLDSFEGEEDVRTGAELEVALARSIPGLGMDDDLYLAADFFAAAGPPAFFAAARARGDSRRGMGSEPGSRWRDLLAEAEVLVYSRPTTLPGHTFVFRAAATAGWNHDIPFQLTLGGERAVRGWPEEAFPGGRRLVLSLENRWQHGWLFPDVADLGTSLFADLGRIWPGDAPFGTDSGWRSTVGAGLRVNFPAGGTQTFRIDLAVPVGHGADPANFQLLIGVGEYLGLSSPFQDPQLGRSRVPPITGSLLHFPQ